MRRSEAELADAEPAEVRLAALVDVLWFVPGGRGSIRFPEHEVTAEYIN